MSLIEVQALSKRFRTPKKAPGMAGAVKHLFRPRYADCAAEYLVEFAKYPITLYDQVIRTVITWILPFAFVSYFPALILLGKADWSLSLAYFSPVVGLLAVLLAAFLWRRGLAQYQSAGN